MPLYKITFPERTSEFGHSFSRESITIELMSSKIALTYKSQVKSSTIENIEFTRQTGKLEKPPTAPRGLYALICAAEKEILRGSPRNQYERDWGNHDYISITNALEKVKTGLKPAKDPSLREINFDPLTFDIGAKILTGDFIGRDKNRYSAILEPLSFTINSEKTVVLRNLDLQLEDGIIKAVLEYCQDGECIAEVKIPNIPNHKDTFAKTLRTYTANAERNFVKQFL